MESVLDFPMNLHFKFHQNRVSNSWDIANIEFVWGGGGVLIYIADYLVFQQKIELQSPKYEHIWVDVKYKSVTFSIVKTPTQPQLNST